MEIKHDYQQGTAKMAYDTLLAAGINLGVHKSPMERIIIKRTMMKIKDDLIHKDEKISDLQNQIEEQALLINKLLEKCAKKM